MAKKKSETVTVLAVSKSVTEMIDQCFLQPCSQGLSLPALGPWEPTL